MWDSRLIDVGQRRYAAFVLHLDRRRKRYLAPSREQRSEKQQPGAEVIEMTKRSRTMVGVGALALVVVCALAWRGYKEAQKRELEQGVIALVQDSTGRLREALELLTAGAEARARPEADFTALEGGVAELRALDASAHPTLVQAAHAYVTDVHALLRRQLALHAGRDAVRADIGEVDNHLRTAGTRSPDWIRQALALNEKLGKSFFDFRFAAGGLEKSLNDLPASSRQRCGPARRSSSRMRCKPMRPL
jgi:hypothetical protein